MNNGVEQKDVLTELERVKLENFALKHNAMQQQINLNMAERTAYIKQVEAAHPGWVWNEAKGLVPVESAAPKQTGPVPVGKHQAATQ
jgi:hypothetical protein